ncbi:hypothetical protein [Dethiosulfatarculus sandiegensis]|nr:hypothetical protein [Dethiosulfatarculus sandiegensis]
MIQNEVEVLTKEAPVLLVWMPTALSGLLEIAPEFFEKWLAPHLDLGSSPIFQLSSILSRKDPQEMNLVCRAVYDNPEVGVTLTRRWPDSFIRQLIAANQRLTEMSGRSLRQLLRTGDMRLFQTRRHSAKISASMQAKTEFLIPYTGRASWKRPDARPNIFEFVAIPFYLGEELFVAGFDREVTD